MSEKDYMYLPTINGRPAMWEDDGTDGQFVFVEGSDPHMKAKLYEDRQEVLDLIDRCIEWRKSVGFEAYRSDYGTVKVLKPKEAL